MRQFRAWGRTHNKCVRCRAGRRPTCAYALSLTPGGPPPLTAAVCCCPCCCVSCRLRLLQLASDEMAGAHAEPEAERRRMVHLYDAYLQARQATDTCYICRRVRVCVHHLHVAPPCSPRWLFGGRSTDPSLPPPPRRELGATLKCAYCERLFHSLCLRDPAVAEEYLPSGKWACPCCGEEQQVRWGGGRGATRWFAGASQGAALPDCPPPPLPALAAGGGGAWRGRGGRRAGDRGAHG